VSAYWGEFQEVVRLWRSRSPSLCAQSALLLVAQGREREAQAELERVPLEVLHRRPMSPGYLGMLCVVGHAASTLGDRARCERAYEELLPFTDRNAVDVIWFALGSVSFYLGLIARALGNHAAARQHFEHATQRNTEFGYRPHAARSRFELARTLAAATDDARQRLRANELLDEIEPDVRKMGLTALLDSIAVLRHSLSADLRSTTKRR
jgi:tetratricopeptide (TPR) repeat protein